MEPPKLCEECKEREATIFLTTVTDGESTSRSFCEACYPHAGMKGGPPLQGKIHEVMMNGHCKYCGASVAGNFGGGGGGGSAGEVQVWCAACGDDLTEFYQRSGYEGLFKEFDPKDQAGIRELLGRMLKFEREMEEFIRQRVKERGGIPADPSASKNPWSGLGVDPARPFPFRHLMLMAAEICAEDLRYTTEAYLFVAEGVSQTCEAANPPSHVNAAAILETLRVRAIARYGSGAREQLRAWGVTSCGDFGEIVYALIAKGIFGKSDNDRREDFDTGYDFETAFP